MPSGVYIHKKGYKRPPFSEEWKSNLSISHKGKRYFPATEFKKGIHPDTQFTSERVVGEKNVNWKGKDVGYFGLHSWLVRSFGNAIKCENRKVSLLDFICSRKSNNFQWAVIHEKGYQRKRENFIQLCISCHKKYDYSNRLIKV